RRGDRPRRVPLVLPRRGGGEPGRHRPDTAARQPGLLRLRRHPALRARRAIEVAPGPPPRPDAISPRPPHRGGSAALPHVLSLRVPALPARLQADDPEPVLQLSRIPGQRRQRQTGERVLPPGDFHHGRASRAPVLMGKGPTTMRRLLILILALATAWKA